MARKNSKPSTEVTKPNPRNLPVERKAKGRGFEEADADSYAIPFLAVLQKNSPPADPDSDAYIKGAKPGMFINTVTQDLYEEVTVIPCAYQRRFNRWAPRDAGGGFKGQFMPSAVPGMEEKGTIKADEDGKLWFPQPDGSINEKKCDTLTDTRMHFCLLVKPDGALQQVLCSLSRTQVKKSKNWMSLMNEQGGDMWDHAYTFTTKNEENEKGTWKGVVIVLERGTEEHEKEQAEAFYNQVMAGKVKVKMEQERNLAAED